MFETCVLYIPCSDHLTNAPMNGEDEMTSSTIRDLEDEEDNSDICSLPECDSDLLGKSIIISPFYVHVPNTRQNDF